LKRFALSDWPRRCLLLLVRGYQLLISPHMRGQCRYEPTCSGYALGALSAHGALAGSYLAAARVLRCHPWCAGGHDPVPDQPPFLFSHFAARAATSSHSRSKTNP
jgi:putative membrane protein insertion efficiency factor